MSKDFIINNLINSFQKLPNIGFRSAKRISLQILLDKNNLLKPLIKSLTEAYDNINKCEICSNLTTDNICEICSDFKRNNNLLCIVENIADLWAIENAGIFNGIYHILDGTLSAIEGRGPDVLKIDNLLKRIKENDIKEIIIATNATTDGQTTAFYLVNVLENLNLKITQPSLGLPMGSELNFLDENTLNIAFKNKKEF